MCRAPYRHLDAQAKSNGAPATVHERAGKNLSVRPPREGADVETVMRARGHAKT
jgi:hypothetical protein